MGVVGDRVFHLKWGQKGQGNTVGDPVFGPCGKAEGKEEAYEGGLS